VRFLVLAWSYPHAANRLDFDDARNSRLNGCCPGPGRRRKVIECFRLGQLSRLRYESGKAGSAKMAFIVQVGFCKPGEGPLTVTKPTRKDALEAAISLRAEGMAGVIIIGDGRTYAVNGFAKTIGD
jgi:hypothetical protein